MRFYFDGKQVVIKSGQHSILYGYEYQGLKESVIRTDSTERLYMNYCEAIASHKAHTTDGPIGTGKTEHIKAFGNKCGRCSVVCNSSPEVKVADMCKILSCIMAPNILFCIDCLDNLPPAKAAEYQTELAKVFAEHPDQELWFFTSMNPNSEKTHNPKLSPKLWVRSKVYVPDLTEIAEHHLAYEGFSEFSTLGSKVIEVWNDCKD